MYITLYELNFQNVGPQWFKPKKCEH